MKLRCKGVLSFCLLNVIFSLAVTPVVSAQIQGSAHDFSGQTWSGGKVCVVCHTPHNADLTVPQSPLWNHEVTSAAFTLYSSPTLDEPTMQPTGPTRLCLSCHDGTVAIDSFGGNTGTTFISGAALIGTDLSDDHPVSITWSHQVELKSCTNCHSGHGGGQFVSQLPFYNKRVECATCHDAHNGSPGNGKMLRLPKQGSALCLYCHQK